MISHIILRKIYLILKISFTGICIAGILSLMSCQQQPKRYVAITFDDLPVVCRCETNTERMEITEKLLAIFAEYDMPVLGVVTERKLTKNGAVDPGEVALMQKWLEAGHELGNHGYSHKDINEITFDEYKQDLCEVGFGKVRLVHQDEFMNSLIRAEKEQR